jgi:HEAT repeat protein
VDGVAELQHAIQRLSDDSRQSIIDGMVPGVISLMRGGDAATTEDGGPPPQQVRAKDAAYLLITHAQAETRTQLVDAVVGWYVADFNGRSLAGNYSAEQVVRSLGQRAATILVDALNAEMPPAALVKLAELISQVGDEGAKQRAGERLVEIEQRMESDEYLDWLKGLVREQVQAQSAEVDEDRITVVASLNRENFIKQGALPAMKHLSTLPVVATRLLAIASTSSTNELMTERRVRALQALEGGATREHLAPLLDLALDENAPEAVRDYAFDRVGDIRAPEAIERMWPLVQDAEKQRLRWRAGEMVLVIGGPAVVQEFFDKLPSGAEVKYEPEELEGYATRMGQMTPPPTDLVRRQLSSSDWWDRVIALRYFERKGTEANIPSMQRHTSDRAGVVGEHWERIEITTVGQVAEAAITGLRERLSGGGGEEEPDEGQEGEAQGSQESGQ